MMDIVEFHPVRAALLDTLNCADTFASSMQKHARVMLLYDKKWFLSRSKVATVVFITVRATAAPKGKTTVGPGSGGMTNAVHSSKVYAAGSMARPDHPWIALCGQDSMQVLVQYVF